MSASLEVQLRVLYIHPVPAHSQPPYVSPLTLLSSHKNMYDLVVVGAGLSGLQAATTAYQAGLSVLVVEARDRVGGKTWSVPLASGRGSVEFGAAWINDTNQRRMWAYAQQFGLEMVKQPAEGKCVMLEEGGKKHTFTFGKSPNVILTRSAIY